MQDTSDYLKATRMKTVRSFQSDTSPLDRYALGYCIAHCSSTTSWDVAICDSDESFLWGLNSNHNCNGIISHLALLCEDNYTFLDFYPEKILHGIEYLEICVDWFGNKVIPLMNNLIVLCIVTLPLQSDTMLASFSNLIHSPKLERVTIGDINFAAQLITKPLGDIPFGLSPFYKLTLINCDLKENSLELLETNTCLTEMSLSNCYIEPPFQTLSKVLRNNKLKKLHIDVTSSKVALDLEQVDTFKAAPSSNTSLEHLTLVIDSTYINLDDFSLEPWPCSLTTDPRVTIEHKYNP